MSRPMHYGPNAKCRPEQHSMALMALVLSVSGHQHAVPSSQSTLSRRSMQSTLSRWTRAMQSPMHRRVLLRAVELTCSSADEFATLMALVRTFICWWMCTGMPRTSSTVHPSTYKSLMGNQRGARKVCMRYRFADQRSLAWVFLS